MLLKGGMGALSGIDKNADGLYNPNIPIYSIEDDLPKVDIVITTTIMCHEEIKRELEVKMSNDTAIVSLEDILY